MERILNCTLSLGSISPDTPLFCGMQGEHRATALVMEPDGALLAEIESKKATGAKVFCRTDIHTLTGECIKGEERDISLISEPFWLTSQMTSSGLDAIAVFHIVVRDGEGQKEIYKAQFPLFFEPSPVFCENASGNRRETDSIKEQTEEAVKLIESRLSRAEELIDIKATALSKRLTEAANIISRAEKLVEYAEESKELLSSDTEFVFVGGDAAHSVSAEFTVEDSFIPDSTNPVQSKAIAEAITKIRADVNDELSNVNAELSNVNAELFNVEKKTNKVEAIYDDATETQYPTAKAVKEYVDAASDSTEQTLKEYIGRVNDYIVEQGTEGRWTYRKWASGIAECWGNTPEELHTITTPYGNAFIETHIQVMFPQNLFVSAPTAMVLFSAQRQSYGCAHATMREVYSSFVEVSVMDNNAPSEKWGFFCISAIGRWK